MRKHLITLFALTALVACDNEEETDSMDSDSEMMESEDSEMESEDSESESMGMASIRVVHLSPDAPNVDIYINETATPITNLAFKAGTAYVDLPADTYSVQIVAAGGDVESPAYEVPALALADGDVITAAAHGYLGGSPNPFVVTGLADSPDMNPSSGFRVQVVHAAAAAAFALVDVWNVTDPMNPTPLITDFDYGAAVTTDLPAGQYDICLDVNGDLTCDATFSLPNLTEGFFNVYAVNDNSGNPSLVAHLPDGSTVDIAPNASM